MALQDRIVCAIYKIRDEIPLTIIKTCITRYACTNEHGRDDLIVPVNS